EIPKVSATVNAAPSSGIQISSSFISPVGYGENEFRLGETHNVYFAYFKVDIGFLVQPSTPVPPSTNTRYSSPTIALTGPAGAWFGAPSSMPNYTVNGVPVKQPSFDLLTSIT